MIIGIDLGTTNSLVSFLNEGQAEIIPNALGDLLTPSVVSVDGDTIVVGKPAVDRLITHPTLTAANFKRFMGSNKVYDLGAYSLRPEELSSFILRRLKEDAEHYLGCVIEEAVISVPAYFSDAQRKATKLAAKMAGLKVERLINEPTAAGISYGLQEQSDDTTYIIIDLGGGTFDVSIINYFSGVIEVRASGGDNHLGGLDFTNIIKTMFLDHLIKEKKLVKEPVPLLLEQKLYEQAEIAKHALSIGGTAKIQIQWDSEILDYEFTNKDFETSCALLLNRMNEPIKRVIADSNLKLSQIDQVILVGGATRMPIVKNLIGRMFGKFPLFYIDPDTVVARGAALQAGFKSNDKALEDYVVTDVCPYSLGVAVCNYNTDGLKESSHFDPIIERNTVIPASRSRLYHPIHPQQSKVSVDIYQGEHFFLEKNILLGKLEVPLPKGLNDNAIEICFTYDINGLLEVETTILETKEKRSLVIERTAGSLNEEQIKIRLSELQKIKIHPREHTENLLALSKAERLYVELHAEKRAQLAHLIKDFISIIERQEPREILRARKQFEDVLEALQATLILR